MKNLIYKYLILISFFVVLISAPLYGQLRLEINSQSVSNPNLDENDFLLPLPCDLTMAFRLIFIPEIGKTGEIKVIFGSSLKNVTLDDGVEISTDFNGKHTVYLGSPLSISNLPSDYKPIAAAIKQNLTSNEEIRQLYLIGKYEVTKAQWQAVMNNNCQLDNGSNLPVLNISFYEVMSFTENLMNYIIKNHPESLPFYEDDPNNIGIIRLPTEEEWEYAARGGHYVSEDDLATYDFFPLEAGDNISNYGYFNDGLNPPRSSPTRIGRYNPNPAGLYDTVGNAEEMTFNPFRMVLGDRLHGSPGGIMRKGGGYRDKHDNVTSGSRRESPLFFNNLPSIYSDLGFRLVISSSNLSNDAQRRSVMDEISSLASTNIKFGTGDPIELLKVLISNTENENQRNALQGILSSIESYNIALNESNRASIRAKIRSMANALMGLRNTREQITYLYEPLRINENRLKTKEKYIQDEKLSSQDKQLYQKEITSHKNAINTILKEINNFETSYDSQREHYENMLNESLEFGELLDSEWQIVFDGIKGKNWTSRELRLDLNIVKNNLDYIRSGGKASDIPKLTLEELIAVPKVLPESLSK